MKELNKEKSAKERIRNENVKAKLSEEQLKELNKEKSAKERIRSENSKAKLSEEQQKELNKERSSQKRKQRPRNATHKQTDERIQKKQKNNCDLQKKSREKIKENKIRSPKAFIEDESK